MATYFGIQTLLELSQLIVDKLENSLDLTTRDKHKYLDFKKAIAEKDKDSLVYLLTKI
jgi:hypothetical protein